MSQRSGNMERGSVGARRRQPHRIFTPATMLAVGMMIIGCPQPTPEPPGESGQPIREIRDLGDILADFADGRGLPEDLGVGLTIESDRIVNIVSGAIAGDDPDLRDELTGPRGDRGIPGAAGSAGLQGEMGAQGARGDQGETGERGSGGAAGDDGMDGQAGPPGMNGAAGATGATGAVGAQGDMGEQGPQGPPGDFTQIPPGTLPGSLLITGSVAGNKLASNAFSGGPTSFQGEIDGSMLGDGTVAGDKLRFDALRIGGGFDGPINGTNLETGTVSGEAIIDRTITAVDIDNDAIQPRHLSFPLGDITAVRTPGDTPLTGGQESGDVTLGVAENGITSQFLDDDIELGDDAGNPGKLSLLNGASTDATIVLDGNGTGDGAELTLRQADGDRGIRLRAAHSTFGQGTLVIYNDQDLDTIGLDGSFEGFGGHIYLRTNDDKRTVEIDADLGSGGGHLLLRNGWTTASHDTMTLDGNDEGDGGAKLVMRNGPSPSLETIVFDADAGDGGARLAMRNGDANGGNPETIVLDANHLGDGAGVMRLGSSSLNDSIVLDADVDGRGAFLNMKNSSTIGTIDMFADDGDGGAKVILRNGQLNQRAIVLDANLGGGNAEIALRDGINAAQTVVLQSRSDRNGEFGGIVSIRTEAGGGQRIQLFGATGEGCFWGTVHTPLVSAVGCDVAEAFELSDPDAVRPGMVLAIDPNQPGRLAVCAESYDKKVAGIVSGAGDLQPGVKLGRRDDGSNDLPIALSGRVYCYVDAREHAVEVGDLLTTSDTPGYAMKAVDHQRAFGAVLGKAMQPLAKGEKGLVLVLVALQ